LIPTNEEIKEAEMLWIKAIQRKSFEAEIKHFLAGKTIGGPIRIN